VYRGIIAIATFLIAFVSWLTVLLYPHILFPKKGEGAFPSKKKYILLRTGIIVSLLLITYSTLSLQRYGNYFLMFIPIITSGMFCTEIAFLFSPRLRTFWPLISGFITIFAFPSILSFCKIAYDMWKYKVNAGWAMYSESSLAGSHFWFIILSIILVVILIIRMTKSTFSKAGISSLGSTIFFVCIGISFYYTVPRKGDDGLLLWMFLVPGFIITNLILFITILVFTIYTNFRKREVIKNNKNVSVLNERAECE